MKKTLLAAAIGFVISYTTLAQTSDVIRIKGGIAGEKAVPFKDRYRYNQFRDGKILYHTGVLATTRLNYNVLVGEMQFIDPHGDTLALANEPVVRLISVSDPGRSSQQDVFYYDRAKGYLELIADYSSIKLVVKQGLKMAKNEKLGAYDQSSGTSAITNYQFYSSSNASVHTMDPKGDLVVIKDKTYFIIDQNNRSSLVNRVNLLKVFSKHREQITEYLAKEPVDFRKEDDLKKLIKYCSELL